MDEKRKAFLTLMHQAHFDAKSAHKYSFDDEEHGQREDKVAALSYAGACVARVSAAQALYYACLDELEHQGIPELFGQFQVFTSEVFNDYATDHSRQWVDIEYNRLEELFIDSVCNQHIIE